MSNLLGKNARKLKRAFTLVELLISISIFVFMTALLVAKYGNFNQSVLLTDLAYDMALAVRTAQTYGVSVRSQNDSFTVPYGVHFSTDSGQNQGFILFADTDAGPTGKGIYNNLDTVITNYSLKEGATISTLCIADNTPCQTSTNNVDITFTRPNPDALICIGSDPAQCTTTFVRIIITGANGDPRSIVVRSTGQIYVEQ